MANISFHLCTDSTYAGDFSTLYDSSSGDFDDGAILFSAYEGIAVSMGADGIQPIASFVEPNLVSSNTYVPNAQRFCLGQVYGYTHSGAMLMSRSPTRALWGADGTLTTKLSTAVSNISSGRPDRVWVYFNGYPISSSSQYGNVMMWNVSGGKVNTSGLTASTVYWISGALTNVYIQGQINFTGQTCSITYTGIKGNTISGTISDYSTLMNYLYLWGTFD